MINEKIIFIVEGMSCSHCVNGIKKAVSGIDGVFAVEVSLESKTVTIDYDIKKVKVEDIKIVIEDEGYIIK